MSKQKFQALHIIRDSAHHVKWTNRNLDIRQIRFLDLHGNITSLFFHIQESQPSFMYANAIQSNQINRSTLIGFEWRFNRPFWSEFSRLIYRRDDFDSKSRSEFESNDEISVRIWIQFRIYIENDHFISKIGRSWLKTTIYIENDNKNWQFG